MGGKFSSLVAEIVWLKLAPLRLTDVNMKATLSRCCLARGKNDRENCNTGAVR